MDFAKQDSCPSLGKVKEHEPSAAWTTDQFGQYAQCQDCPTLERLVESWPSAGPHTAPRTKKAAREAGFVAERDLAKQGCREIPRRDAGHIVIKGEVFYARADCERLLNKTDARRLKRLVPNGLEPVEWRSWKYGYFGLWRESDLVPVAKRVTKRPVAIDLLAAVFSVNRSAKRYRNAASCCYASRTHGLAKAARIRKELLYRLKDQGIAEAIRQGRIQFVGRNGTLALYRGEGYCFHSRLLPPGQGDEHSDSDVPVFVEAKPKGTGEARLKDAVHTLEALRTPEGFTLLSLPRYERPIRFDLEPTWEEDGEGWDDDWDEEAEWKF
jgi:hypothetical protein